mgnify:FL=1
MRLQISSGNGPEECELAVRKFLDSIKKEFKNLEIVETSKGKYKDTYKYVVVESTDDLSFLEGSIKWICESPYRKNHKRKNWFIDVSVISGIQEYYLDEDLIKFETFRCSGNGGQNVNKVESGVRAIYEPLKLIVEATEERNQKMNKNIAIRKLEKAVKDLNNKALKDNSCERWLENKAIERGNEIRIYKGKKFLRIK